MIKESYTVCSLWLAKELDKRGYKCIGKSSNQKKPEFDVFHFEDSKELRKEIEEIVRVKQNAKISKSKNNQNR